MRVCPDSVAGLGGDGQGAGDVRCQEQDLCRGWRVCTATGQLFTSGRGIYGQLGHGGKEDEFVPRLVEALGGKKVIGAAAGEHHTAIWTDAGSSSPLGVENMGGWAMAGHRMSFCRCWATALQGTQVVGAAAGSHHTAVWTEEEELFTLGTDSMGRWATEGHRQLSQCCQAESVPRQVEALAEV